MALMSVRYGTVARMADMDDSTDDAMATLARTLHDALSDSKARMPPHSRWLFDAERQQFVREPIGLMVDQAIREVFRVEYDDADLDQPRPHLAGKAR
jgi:hypothetical protein